MEDGFERCGPDLLLHHGCCGWYGTAPEPIATGAGDDCYPALGSGCSQYQGRGTHSACQANSARQANSAGFAGPANQLFRLRDVRQCGRE